MSHDNHEADVMDVTGTVPWRMLVNPASPIVGAKVRHVSLAVILQFSWRLNVATSTHHHRRLHRHRRCRLRRIFKITGCQIVEQIFFHLHWEIH